MQLHTGLKSSVEAAIGLRKYVWWLLLNVILIQEGSETCVRIHFEKKREQENKISFPLNYLTFFAVPRKCLQLKSIV